MDQLLSQLTPNAQTKPHADRVGISVVLKSNELCVSPQWNLGGVLIQFVRLPENQSIDLDVGDGRVCLKVVVGEVDCGTRTVFPPVGEVASTEVTESGVTAVVDSVLCVFTLTEKLPTKITSMAALAMQGPHDDLLIWQSFEQRFGEFTDIFDGLEAHMIPGFHLVDPAGEELAYVHFWTTGKGVDVSTHDHGGAPSPLNPAFCEVHLVLRNGTGEGAMYQCKAPGDEYRKRTKIQSGEEHGPFFHFDEATGKPGFRANGAVDYPWHGWQGGVDTEPTESYDLVAAFEINPDKVLLQASG